MSGYMKYVAKLAKLCYTTYFFAYFFGFIAPNQLF